MREPHDSLLNLISERAAALLAADAAAQAFLRDNGVGDAAVWRAYRLGASGPDLLDGLDGAQRAALAGLGLLPRKGRSALATDGILIPAFDPREPERVVGLVKLAPAQNRHGFATARAGIACAHDLADNEALVVADAPLLMLRLARAGRRGVVLAEDSAVLAPLADWLKGREVVACSYLVRRLKALSAALKALGVAHQAVRVEFEMARTNEKLLAQLGLDKAVLKAAAEPSPAGITARLLRDLHRYARQRLAEGAGLEALGALNADDAVFVETFQIGFLPSGFRDALPKDAKRALQGTRIANAAVLPAYDERGAVVDLFAVGGDGTNSVSRNLTEPAQGLLGPNVATAFDHLVVTDSIRHAGYRFKQGERNVLLLRGLEDARRNAQRLADAGVRSAIIICRRQAKEIAAALEAVGIAVERQRMPKTVAPVEPAAAEEKPAAAPVAIEPKPTATKPTAAEEDAKAEITGGTPTPVPEPTPVPAAVPVEPTPSEPAALADPSIPPLELVNHDRRAERATFKGGEATYTVEVSLDADTRLEVGIQRGGELHRDRFDLAVAAQRRRFAESAAIRTKVPFEAVEEHLLRLLDEVRRLQDALLNPSGKASPAASITAEDRAQALALLKRADLLDAIRADLDALGWVGEDDAKLLLYMVALSRKLPDPLWAASRASAGAGKSHGLDVIAELTPPEELIHVSRLTDSALYYQNGNALRNKLVLLDEADSLTSEVIVALRVLKTRGALSLSHVQRDFATGGTRTEFVEAKGPVSVLTSTAGGLDAQLLSRCYDLPVDESPEQTEKVLEAQRKAKADPAFWGSSGTRARIVALHRNAQRLLECRPVLIPFADRIAFPATSVRHRREQERFLALIEASALLHQHQRLKDGDFVVADVRDFEVARRLAGSHVERAQDSLTGQTRELLAALRARGAGTFTIRDLEVLRPGWTRHAFRAALAELLALEYVLSPRGGRGRLRKYRVTPGGAPTASMPTIRLREVGELAKVGEGDFANLIPGAVVG
ncbi:MAG: hypothetical protein M5U26_19605 [Planctomycetota bacterium]|nr:hypothetical protein [Planctomycetota bacterium]